MDKRKYERVYLSASANIYVTDAAGEKIGFVRMLGLGGILIDTDKPIDRGDRQEIVLVDESEGIRRRIRTMALYAIPSGVGLKFERLDEQTAVEIGVIIGKHHARVAPGAAEDS